MEGNSLHNTSFVPSLGTAHRFLWLCVCGAAQQHIGPDLKQFSKITHIWEKTVLSRYIIKLFVLSSLLCGGNSFAAASDLKDSKDHPLILRYPGSTITTYTATDFDEYKVATGRVKNGVLPTQNIEGKVTTIIYALPLSVTTLQVMRNYENALKEGGFKTTLSCDAKTCGNSLPAKLIASIGPRAKMEQRYFQMGIDDRSTGPDSDYRFWTGVLERGGTKTYLTLFVQHISAGPSDPGYAALDVVESKNMEIGLVSLDVKSIDAAIKAQGKVVLDGLYFDHDKDTIKPDSAPTLKTIADYLNANLHINAYVVGHTDNSGDYTHNLSLSQKRAAAVIRALVTEYKIANARLIPVGIGPVSPATRNTTDADKAKNRRVELVLR